MIKINLLSPSDKENFKWEKINNLIKGWTIWMLLVQIVFFAAFLFAVEYLKIEKSAVTSQLEQIKNKEATKEIDSIEKELRTYAAKIDDIAELKDSHLHWSYVLAEIIGNMPSGVRLEGFSAQEVVAVKEDKKKPAEEERYKIDISGNALTRNDLLIFEGTLKNSELFFGLEYDDSNYVKSADVDFRYSFYIYKKDLLK